MSVEQNCKTCGYVEREGNSNSLKMYCTNCKSDYCFNWVSPWGHCPYWIQYTKSTRFYNEFLLDDEDCGKAD